MEEDEDEQLAKQLQNEMYGAGGGGAQSNPADMGFGAGFGGGPPVRQADEQQFESLIGGPDPMDYHPRRNRQAQREMPMPQPPPYVPEPSHMPAGHGMGDGMEIDEDQAAIARAVEESLRNNQNQPLDNYDEEAEL